MRHLNHFKNILLPVLLVIGLQPALAITNGTFTVGPGGDFPDMAGAVSDLNGSTINGPVILNILSGSYSGSAWQFELTNISGASATNTITIQPQSGSGTVTISVAGSSSNNYVARLNNASFITIKNIKLINTTTGGTGAGRVVDIAGSSSSNVIEGCELEGASGSATSNDRAIVLMGTQGSPLTGTGNVVYNNTLVNGYCGVYIYGTSTASPTANHIISTNTITDPYTYGLYANAAGNLTLLDNSITGTETTLTHAIYTLNNQDGGNVSGNVVDINTTTGTHYGIYNDYQNSVTGTGATMDGNTITLTVTSGTAYPLYNRYSKNLSITTNIFSGNAGSSGIVYPPVLMYYCSNSTASNNTFNSTATTGGVASSGAYYFMSNATDCYVRANTFNNTVTTGKIIGNAHYFMYYASNSHCNNNIFNYTATTGQIWNASSGNFMNYSNNSTCDSNKFNFTSTTGLIGQSSSGATSSSGIGAWCNAVGSSFDNNHIVIDSKYTGTSYGLFGYYSGYNSNQASNFSISNDTFDITLTASSTNYLMGYYAWYAAQNTTLRMNNNILNFNAPNGTSTLYAWGYYMGYYNTLWEFNNNKFTFNTTSAGTVYATPYLTMYYCKNAKFNSNVITVNTTSGTIYNPYSLCYYGQGGSESVNNTFTTNSSGASIYSPYYLNLYGTGAHQANNTFNITGGSGTIYCPYGLNYQGAADTVENNTWTVTATSGSINMYNYYLSAVSRNNTWNLNSTSGSIYNYYYYNQGGLYLNNTLKATTTTGAIYGIYDYNPSTSYSHNLHGNVFDLRSTSGTIYGYYAGYYPCPQTFVGNVLSTKTSGTSYLYYSSYGAYGDQLFLNNTFHSNSTGSTNRFIYQSGGSGTYPGKLFMYNNVFSKSTASTGNTIDIGDTAYFKTDYNLIYSPGTVTIRAATPSITTTDLDAWRQASGNDANSIFHDPGFMDAANYDFRPNPASVNSWALQGRGVHVDKDTVDILWNPRAKNRFEGVPDIGAYEFTPTSTPENAVAIPSTPAANSTQVFIYAGDTVCSIDWGNTVPASINVKQYTGVQAAVTPGITERMYFYVDVQTPVGVYEYKPTIRYKNPWLGNISNETNARIAKSSNGGLWAGYNYNNGVTDSIHNYLMPKDDFDSLSSKFTGVENARIGIRCVVPPTGLSHSAVTAFSATETWEPIFSPYGYQLIVDSIQSPLDMTKIQFTSVNTPPTYPISGLTENTTYYVNIRTICGLKDTSDWSVDSFRTMITCHAPTVHATSVTDRQAVIYWDTVQTAISYEYTVDESPNAPGFGTTIFTNTTFASGLNPGTKYYAHVRSHCSTIYDISDWTNYEFNTLWPAGIEELNGAAGITVYPNPSKNVLNINLIKTPGNGASITIADITGKVVYSSSITSTKQQVNLEPMPSGVYTLKYIDNDRTEIIKITKE